jgi:hypothetical protein
MAQISTAAVSALSALLTGPNGLADRIAQLSSLEGAHDLPLISNCDIVERHVAAELVEKTSGVRYPAVNVYCERVVNDLREKFRRFSGTADLVVEIRVSHEHMDPLQAALQIYTEAVADVLERKRGKWAPGVFYTGGYTVQYGPIKRGGRSFLQSAKVELTIQGSME